MVWKTLLDTPFYTGIIRSKRTGKSFPGIHERLISPALYEAGARYKSGKADQRSTKTQSSLPRAVSLPDCGAGANGSERTEAICLLPAARSKTATLPKQLEKIS